MFLVARGQTFGTPLGVRCRSASSSIKLIAFSIVMLVNIALLKECLIRVVPGL